MDNRSIDITSEGKGPVALAMQLIWEGVPSGKVTHYRIVKLRKEVRYFSKSQPRGPDQSEEKITYHSKELVEDKENGTPTLILLWSDEHECSSLPFPLDLEGAVDFVQRWLQTVDYPSEPDHDGDNEKGWRMFTDFWGHVANYHYSIVGVQPAWAMYGK